MFLLCMLDAMGRLGSYDHDVVCLCVETLGFDLYAVREDMHHIGLHVTVSILSAWIEIKIEFIFCAEDSKSLRNKLIGFTPC